MNNYTIALMTVNHYDEVYQLWKTHDGIGLSNADSKENIKIFLERNDGLSFVALMNNRIIGTILGGHDGRRGYVYHLIVVSSLRSNGIGKALVRKCIERYKELGIEKIHVFVFKDNTTGVRFWEKIGCKLRNDLYVMSFDNK